MEAIEKIKLGDGYTFELHYDSDSGMFFDELWENGVSFISNHRDYDSKGELSDIDIENILDDEFRKTLEEENEIIEISSYIHGGIALYIGHTSPCQWDSGTFGFLVFKKGEFGENNIGLKSFVRSWEALLNGEVYGFVVTKAVTCKCCEHTENEVIESCWGFYGYNGRKDLLEYMKGNIDLDKKYLDLIK